MELQKVVQRTWGIGVSWNLVRERLPWFISVRNKLFLLPPTFYNTYSLTM